MINYFLYIDSSLNHLNRLEQGIVVIIFGVIFLVTSMRFHRRNYKDVDIKPFKPFKIEGKSNSENYVNLMVYHRSLFSIYLGYFIIICGLACVVAYFW